MFIDEVYIRVVAGNGGDGVTSFRREKYVPEGGPNGGNGGRGSNIIFKVDEGLKTLLDLRYRKQIIGDRGDHGKGKDMNGRNAVDVVIRVPLGTVVKDEETGNIIADLVKKDEEVIVAYGGRGGRGNSAFATASNPAPDFSEHGEPGEERKLKVELKLLAEVGLVGMPSVGKSTILSKISRAKPKIAEYHFTTLSPNLGVVKTIDNRIFTVADLPGLIEGASKGEGLGDRFLKHIERTKLIAHVLDMGAVEGRDPYSDYLIINNELKEFSNKLSNKPMIVIANKMDMPEAKDNLNKFKSLVDVPVYEISAIDNNGLDSLLLAIADILDNIQEEPLYNESEIEAHVLYKFKKEKPFTIYKDSDTWVVSGETIEKLFRMTKFSSSEGALRFAKKLKAMGVDDKLRELGAKEGDSVRILDYEFQYLD